MKANVENEKKKPLNTNPSGRGGIFGMSTGRNRKMENRKWKMPIRELVLVRY